MHIAILGHGSLADCLARAAERAGHAVVRAEPNAKGEGKVTASMLVVADAPEVDVSDPTLRGALADGAVVVDAVSPSVLPRLMKDATAPEAKRCVVRAFASVPADRLERAIERGRSDGGAASLAVPLVGDNHNAKVVVEKFIRDIGLEPFDVGALGTVNVIEPGGALWGKAYTPTEMLEAVGDLSGDG